LFPLGGLHKGSIRLKSGVKLAKCGNFPFANLHLLKDKSTREATREATREDLLRYCYLDTYAMVKFMKSWQRLQVDDWVFSHNKFLAVF
jgi:hypothetical protein